MSVPGITYLFVWHAEPGACDQCARLNGRVFADQDIFQDTLWDQFEGDIWDFNIDFPLTHGSTGAHCRCTLETRIEVDYEKLQEIKDTNEMTQLLAYDIEEATGETITVPEKNKIEEFTEVGQIAELRTNIQQLKTEIDSMNISYHKLREAETVLSRTITLIERSNGGNPDIEKYTRTASDLLTTLRAAQMTINTINASSGPIGWVLAGLGVVSTMYLTHQSASDIVNDYLRGTT
jgi:hypothetical protein